MPNIKFLEDVKARIETINDQLLLMRYWYYVKSSPIDTDSVYDVWENNMKVLIELHPQLDSPDLEIHTVGSSIASYYPEWVKHRPFKYPQRFTEDYFE